MADQINLTPKEDTTSSEDLGYASNVVLSKNAQRTPERVRPEQMALVESEAVQKIVKRRSRCRKPRAEQLLVILTVAGVILGILLGFTIRLAEPSDTTIELVKFPGELMMRMLKMMIIPIIITSIVTGLASLDMKKSGRMGVHAIIYYLATTTLAVILGIILVTAIHPGNPIQWENTGEGKNKEVSTMDTFLDLVRNIFPENIIAACFELAQTDVDKDVIEVNNTVNDTTNLFNVTSNSSNYNVSTAIKITKTLNRIHSPNVLGLIAFSVAFGITLSSLGEEGKRVTRIFQIFNDIFMKMIMVVIWYSPVGICSLTAANILKMGGLKKIGEILGMYIVTVITGLMIHGFIILPLIYLVLTRRNPYKFAYGVLQALLTALGTASSTCTLPVTMRCLENNLGIDKRVTQFVLPIGATMNMDGTALLEGVASITIAQMYDISLSFGQIITISLTATVASIGAAAIPSSGLVTLLLVLTAIGIPTDAVALLWSVDWFVDRIRTAINVFGDCVGAGIVYHKNQEHLKQVDNQELMRAHSAKVVEE